MVFADLIINSVLLMNKVVNQKKWRVHGGLVRQAVRTIPREEVQGVENFGRLFYSPLMAV